ncbi:hypothetical protein [Pseudonocardia sp. C8]|nr:hypothetical protein [Pseudonocardia sp. C8]
MTTNTETTEAEPDQDAVAVPPPRRTGRGESWVERLGWEEVG